MGRPYKEELDFLPQCMEWAWQQDVTILRRAFRHFSDRSLLPIGSGGSFTAAAFAAQLHQDSFGRPSLPFTPIDVFGLPQSRTTAAAGFLISAEGKNKDILAASRELLARRIPTIALTLTQDNPLGRFCAETGAATHIAYAMPWGKDGYLATNSLVATLLLTIKASEANMSPQDYAGLVAWLAEFRSMVGSLDERPWARKSVLILHGMTGRMGALDLESKVTESAMAFGQIANFRQFAHGRHLQLASPGLDMGIIAFTVQGDELAEATLELIPSRCPMFRVLLPPLGKVAQEFASVLAALVLTEAWAGEFGVDPGQPSVPQFGRDLHQLDAAALARSPHNAVGTFPPAQRKWSALGPSAHVTRAQDYQDFLSRLGKARFKALVCDFDGTFCDTIRRFEGLDSALVPQLTRLLSAGVRVGFATGRGDSIIKQLKKIPEEYWPLVTVGIHSGSTIFQLDAIPLTFGTPDPRLYELAKWLVDKAVVPRGHEFKIERGQMSMRDVLPTVRDRAKEHIAEWIKDTGAVAWRVFASGHSIDVLTDAAHKGRVIDEVSRQAGADPLTEILRLGDAGEAGGNDYEMLREGFSLSVDTCSSVPHTCWNLLPCDRIGVVGTAHYLRSLVVSDAQVRLSSEFFEALQLAYPVDQAKASTK